MREEEKPVAVTSIDELFRYGSWIITYDPPPIPLRTLDWTYVHEDYDGAEDSGDRRLGYAPDIATCIVEINEIEGQW